MPKILKDTELLDIVRRTIEENEIKDESDFLCFLEDLALVVCGHFGGQPGTARDDKDLGLGFTVAIHLDNCVPDDGGIFARYDTDIQWLDGREAA